MSAIVENTVRSRASFVTPMSVLAAAVLVLLVLLLIVPTVPIGSMYWDLYIYFDAANRIFEGQVPSVDFMTPVGPLGYWLFAGAISLFPEAQPLLLVEWSLFAVSAPLMALVIHDVDSRDRPVAYGLLLPFLFFAVLPFNVREYFIFAGTDGFGIYNRQAAILLYILVASIAFVRSQRLLTILMALCMLALFFTKISGFAVGGLICLFAFAAGRVQLVSALASGLLFLAVIGAVEIATGLVSAYVDSIRALLALNTKSITSQLASKFAQNFKVILPVIVLIGLYVILDWRGWLVRLTSTVKQPGRASFNRLLDNHAAWLAVLLVAGVLYESQNWGSQDMIFVWPVLLAVIADIGLADLSPTRKFVIRLVAFAAIIPVTLIVAERSVRAWAGVIRNQPLEHQNLKTLGSVSMRYFQLRRAEVFARIYPQHRAGYEAIAAAEVLPSYALFSQFKYQIGYLMHIDDAVGAIREMESATGARFDTMFHISFTNPFPWLMDRSAPKYVAIGADPFRAVPVPDERVLNSVAAVDIALFPTCPVIYTNEVLLELYGGALAGHKRIRLTRCYDAFVHPDKVSGLE